MFGTDSILSFLDSLRTLIEKQKEQLKEQISEIDTYDHIQEHLMVGRPDLRAGGPRVRPTYSSSTMPSNPSAARRTSLTTMALSKQSLRSSPKTQASKTE